MCVRKIYLSFWLTSLCIIGSSCFKDKFWWTESLWKGRCDSYQIRNAQHGPSSSLESQTIVNEDQPQQGRNHPVKAPPGQPPTTSSVVFILSTPFGKQHRWFVLWPSDAKSWLVGKDPDAGKDWRREKKGTTEGEMVGWHHRLNGQEFEQAPGVGDGQGGLCAAVHGVAKSQTWLNDWTEQNWALRWQD